MSSVRLDVGLLQGAYWSCLLLLYCLLLHNIFLEKVGDKKMPSFYEMLCFISATRYCDEQVFIWGSCYI